MEAAQDTESPEGEVHLLKRGRGSNQSHSWCTSPPKPALGITLVSFQSQACFFKPPSMVKLDFNFNRAITDNRKYDNCASLCHNLPIQRTMFFYGLESEFWKREISKPRQTILESLRWIFAVGDWEMVVWVCAQGEGSLDHKKKEAINN